MEQCVYIIAESNDRNANKQRLFAGNLLTAHPFFAAESSYGASDLVLVDDEAFLT